jgi:type IV pilus assembly protein PilW
MKSIGFSLVELMVSMVLGLVITSGVITVFISMQNSYMTTQGISMMQENSHFMRYFLAESVSSIGQVNGCSQSVPLGNLVKADDSDYEFNISGHIQGYEIAGDDNTSSSTVFPATLSADRFVEGSDFFEIQTLTEVENNVVIHQTQNGIGTPSKLRVNKNSTISNNGIYTYIAPDCTEAVLFHATGKSDDGAIKFIEHTTTASSNLVRKFKNCVTETKTVPPYTCSTASFDSTVYTPTPYSKLFKAEHIAYGIKQSDDNEAGIYSLVKIDLQGAEDDNESILLSGIRTFQLSYGILDSSNSAGIPRVHQYFTAAELGANASDWEQVAAIKIKARITALSDITGAVTDANNNFDDVYRDIEQVITLRNRIFTQ